MGGGVRGKGGWLRGEDWGVVLCKNKDSIERHNSKLLQSPHCTMNCLQHVSKWPGRNHVQITCNTSRNYHLQHVVCHVVLLSLAELKLHLFELYFIG